MNNLKRLLLALSLIFLLVGSAFGAITFDNVDDLVSVADATSLQNLGPLTYSFWFNQTATDAAQLRIFSREAPVVGFIELAITANQKQLIFYVDYDVGVNQILRQTTTNVYSTGVWNHILLTWDASSTATNIHIYVNGTEVSSYATTTNGGTVRDSDVGANQIIGNRADGTRCFDGSITEVAFWNKVLSSANITSLYASGSPTKGIPLTIEAANLKGYWAMTDGTIGTSADGDTVADTSGQGNNGTAYDGANNTGCLWATEIPPFPSAVVNTLLTNCSLTNAGLRAQ